MSKTNTLDPDEIDAEFSVIRFFDYFQKQIKTLGDLGDNAPRLTIQKDEYARLGGASEYIPEEKEDPFASYQFTSKDSDTTLRFAIDFYEDWFLLHIENCDSFGGVYGLIFTDEKSAANEIVSCIKMLLNGSLRVVISMRNGKECARELVCYASQPQFPVVIFTDAHYRMFWRSSDQTGYECKVLRNNLSHDEVEIPKNFFMFDYDEKGEVKPHGRIIHNEVTPLTKGDYEFVINEIGMRAAGKKPGEIEWMLYYRSWEFWAVVLTAIGSYWIAVGYGLIPSLGEYGHVIAGIVWALVFRAFVDRLLVKKESLRLAQPQHPWVRFDVWVQDKLPAVAFTLYAAFTLLLFSWHIFAVQGIAGFASYYDLSQKYLWLSIAPALAVMGMLYSWRAHKRTLYVPGLFISVATILFGIANFMYTDTNAETPEPYTTIAIFCCIAAVILLPIFAFYLYKSHYDKPAPTKRRDIWEVVAKWIDNAFIVTNIIGSAVVTYAGVRMLTTLDASMITTITPSIYAYLNIGIGAILFIMSLVVYASKKGSQLLYYTQILTTMLLFGIFGFFSTDKINNLDNLTFALQFGGLFMPMFIGISRTYSREYIHNKSMTARNL